MNKLGERESEFREDRDEENGQTGWNELAQGVRRKQNRVVDVERERSDFKQKGDEEDRQAEGREARWKELPKGITMERVSGI